MKKKAVKKKVSPKNKLKRGGFTIDDIHNISGKYPIGF